MLRSKYVEKLWKVKISANPLNDKGSDPNIGDATTVE